MKAELRLIKKEKQRRNEEEKQNKKRIVEEERKMEKIKNEGRAILSVFIDENEDAFQVQSKNIDVLAARDKDENTILHLFGMQYWSEKKTEMIHAYCKDEHLFDQQLDIDEEDGPLLQSIDKITTRLERSG